MYTPTTVLYRKMCTVVETLAHELPLNDEKSLLGMIGSLANLASQITNTAMTAKPKRRHTSTGAEDHE